MIDNMIFQGSALHFNTRIIITGPREYYIKNGVIKNCFYSQYTESHNWHISVCESAKFCTNQAPAPAPEIKKKSNTNKS